MIYTTKENCIVKSIYKRSLHCRNDAFIAEKTKSHLNGIGEDWINRFVENVTQSYESVNDSKFILSICGTFSVGLVDFRDIHPKMVLAT